MKLTIDEEFKNIIPPLSEAEYKQLEQNILKEGCRDRIITWNDMIIDGHNRHSICEKHGIEYDVMAIDHFENRHEVIDWMIHNQIGKRNLSGGTISYLRGLKLKREKLKQLAEKIQEEVQTEKENITPENKSAEITETVADPISEERKEKENAITEEVAKKYKISTSTIKNDERFTNAVDTIHDNVGKKIKDKILTKELKLNPFEVMSISKMEKDKQKELLSGEDEEIIEKINTIKEEKKSKNTEKALEKLEKEVDDINYRLNGVTVNMEVGEKNISLYYTSDEYEDDSNHICNFKDTKNVSTYLKGFADAIKMLNEVKTEEY